MLTTEDLCFFTVLAKARSLTAASRTLEISPSAVTQRLQTLESRLNTHLIDRAGRKLTLTSEGELMVKRGTAILGDLNELDEALAESHGVVRGHLRVVASYGFGRRYIAPVVAAFHKEHPGVRVDLYLSDRMGGIPDDGWDVAIHVGDTNYVTPGLLVRRLAANEHFVCASPAYLKRHGTPSEPKDLKHHAYIALRENDEDVTLVRFRSSSDEAVESVRLTPHLASNDSEVVYNWVSEGHGIMIRSEWQVGVDLQAGRLKRILADFRLPDAPVVALLSSRPSARAARTTQFLRAVERSLSPIPWRLPTIVRATSQKVARRPVSGK